MQRGPLDCWKCGASLAALTLPLSRTDSCRACRAEIHVCRMCRFYDTGKAKSCAEPVADEVHDKERANFCGYFEPAEGRFKSKAAGGDMEKDALEALFRPKKVKS
jgi:hypothetical protein